MIDYEKFNIACLVGTISFQLLPLMVIGLVDAHAPRVLLCFTSYSPGYERNIKVVFISYLDTSFSKSQGLRDELTLCTSV